MEFRYDLKKLLPQEISFVDNSLVVKGWQSSTRNRVEYQQLYDIINIIGEASAFAQGLNKVITSSEKMQNSDHLLYLMREEEENGRVVLIGMLKIGRKKLFLLDENKQTKEVAPLCVLDFYIHESKQRRGYGRRMFDYMLKHQNIEAAHMAVDKPADKFICFLKKHYGLSKQIPQVNNFIVYEEFFKERPVTSEEAALTQVSRSNRSSRTASPEGNSPSSSQRGSITGVPASGFAGKPSRCNDSSMSDILQGKVEQYHPSIRVANRHQTTLDWMRGPSTGGESPYNRTPASYSPSKTPSYGGSPRAVSPPRSRYTGGRKHIELLDDGIREESIAPTPSSSPDGHSPRKQANGEADDTDAICEKAEFISLQDEELALGKTGAWRDNVSRSSEGLVEHMSSSKGSTMTGVLTDRDSVHGHLKFHHHALW